MKKSKLIRLLKMLDRKEFKRFQEFVASPYFNKNKKCVELLAALRPFAPEFEDERIKQILADIYSNKNSIKTLLRDMVRLFERFLASEELDDQPFYEQFMTMKQLIERKEAMHFMAVYKRSIREFNNKSQKSLLEFFHQFLIATTYFDYQFTTASTGDPKYEDLLHHLDTVYLANRLKYSSSMVTLQRLTTGEKSIPSENAMLQLASEDRLVGNAVVLLYKTAYQLIVENTQDWFYQLKGLLGSNINELPKDEAISLYTVAMNFCIRSIAVGKVEYYGFLFEIYQECIQKQLFVVNGEISINRFFNTVIVGVKTENFDWVEQFLDSNKQLIEGDFREMVFQYSKGYLYHGKGQFDAAAEALLLANAEQMPQRSSQYSMVKFLKFNIQQLLLKIYYENEEVLAFESLIKSFAERLRQTQNIEAKSLRSYLNFISVAHALFRLKTDPNYRKSLGQIQERVAGLQEISDKAWIASKIRELTNKF